MTSISAIFARVESVSADFNVKTGALSIIATDTKGNETMLSLWASPEGLSADELHGLADAIAQWEARVLIARAKVA